MTDTSQRRSPPSEGILQEWAKHWPFERASAELIRKAQQAERQRKREVVREIEEALMWRRRILTCGDIQRPQAVLSGSRLREAGAKFILDRVGFAAP